MNDSPCPHTDALLAAHHGAGPGGGPDSELLDHLAGCATCARALFADSQLKSLAGSLARAARLPAPQVVQFRARLRARAELAERSLRPLAVWRGVAAVVAAVGLGLGLGLSGPLFTGMEGTGAAAGDPARLLTACGLLTLLALPFFSRLRGLLR